MGELPKPTRLLLVIAFVGAVVLSPARQTGGSYTLSLNGGTAFPISSIDFGDTSVVNNGNGSAAGKTQLSPVTITVSAATAQLYSLFSSCVTGQHLAKVSAVYSNAQGQTQFTVNFQPVVVTSYTFPTVDTTSAPLGDITIVLTAATEQYSTPPPANRTLTNSRLTTQLNLATPPITRKWHTALVTESPSSKFTFTIPNFNTSGVTSVLSFAAKDSEGASASGSGAGKLTFTSFSLTVNPTSGANFIKDAQTQAHVSTVTLVLNRPSPTGANMPMTIVFHDVLFTGFNIGGDHPIATVNFIAAKVGVAINGVEPAIWTIIKQP